MEESFIIQKINDNILALFGKKRVVCFLFYGSRAFNKTRSRHSDFDFFLLLEKSQTNDLVKIKKFIKNHAQKIDITVQYLDDIQRRGLKNFQQGNHGLFFICYLATAKCLIGKNIFQIAIDTEWEKEIQASLMRQIEEYFWRLNNAFINSTKWKTFYKKYLVRIAMDCLLIDKQMSFEAINQTSSREIITKYILKSPIFSRKTKKLFEMIYLHNQPLETHFLDLSLDLRKDYLHLFRTQTIQQFH